MARHEALAGHSEPGSEFDSAGTPTEHPLPHQLSSMSRNAFLALMLYAHFSHAGAESKSNGFFHASEVC